MRILMTADTVGGVWTYALELIGALSAHGVEVALATMGRPASDAQRAELAELPNARLYQSAYRLEWMDAPWDDVDAAGDWLGGLGRRLGPDLVHLNGYAHAALPWGRPVLVVGHSCVLSWWQAVKGTPAPEGDWATYRRRVQQGLGAADAVAAPTQAMLDELARLYGPLPRPTVIHNARRADLFVPARKEPIVFAAGRLWDQAKNLAALARVAPQLPWPVHLAGDAQGPNGRDRTLPDGVCCLGTLDRPGLADWLGRAGLHALPAHYEPFGLGALEAALAGCPLVLGDIPSLREVWGEAALYVAPTGESDLTLVLTYLARDERLRAEFAARARRRAARYTPQRQAQQYLALYRSLLGAGPRVRGWSAQARPAHMEERTL